MDCTALRFSLATGHAYWIGGGDWILPRYVMTFHFYLLFQPSKSFHYILRLYIISCFSGLRGLPSYHHIIIKNVRQNCHTTISIWPPTILGAKISASFTGFRICKHTCTFLGRNQFWFLLILRQKSAENYPPPKHEYRSPQTYFIEIYLPYTSYL